MPYGSPGSGWGAPPPPQPPKRNTGKIVGFGCLGVLLLFVVLGVIGGLVAGSGDDSSKGSGAVVEESTSKATPRRPPALKGT
ncbi:hypothetical protein OHT59_29465 [Streptomyces sp. NBC_00243]|uniref:hypothetical protein n=1 Tax=Streptomyces sp. NBC_00243 TaxID=2975688 RepID=UPI002DD826B9|nr:hypothetical protein [Streptomyces sp. NBC_00243]WRZ22316.1 hypothetical protein OHT59_29465 [Streptomyces sp. NBC_00243]